MTQVHLDTDLGTNMDDLAALAMLLGAAGVDLTAVTTCMDPGGRRAGYVRHALGRAGAADVAVAAGAEVSMTTLTMPGRFPDDAHRWPEAVPPAPAPPGAALRLLGDSVDAGATIVAIGPYTNLGLLGVERPALLARAKVVVMGGWFDLPRAGLPPWGPDRDSNVQHDTDAARMVIDHAGELTMVPIPLTLRVHLRGDDLGRLRAAGPLGRLVAFQAERQGAEQATRELAAFCPAVPGDLLNFQHDPLACAAALGWPCVTFDTRRVGPELDGGVLRLVEDPAGRPVRVAVDGWGGPRTWTPRPSPPRGWMPSPQLEHRRGGRGPPPAPTGAVLGPGCPSAATPRMARAS